eukprot:CAMPEP_0181114112 /NCGR_PEP_ID=MMETSP1071-20121207/20705_1 /TAXON_ID=35127 /ORGANISM="Thalassiosira sp., Strain NH16" /LENGTH=352 /DNA_ID=CAMNT_0023198191 /DNA_START=50 /DNA_END=1108 /DNA_ORIENTATION=-
MLDRCGGCIKEQRAIVVLCDTKEYSWMSESSIRLHDMLQTYSADAATKAVMAYCDNSSNRYVLLLKKMLTKTSDNPNINSTRQLSTDDPKMVAVVERKAKKKGHTLPDHYKLVIKSLQKTMVPENNDHIIPTWKVLMPQSPSSNGETKYLSLPQRPKWVSSCKDLLSLQAELHATTNGPDGSGQILLDNFIAFDSEFRSDKDGITRLATIQFSILKDGVPLAWVVDLHPDPSDDLYSTMTCDMLRWVFVESNARILGFAHHHDLQLIASYIGEGIIPSTAKFLDLQTIAAHKMTGNGMPSLPGLKTCCSHWMHDGNDTTSWSLSKREQCSDWARRPLSANQLDYAGLDAAVR